LPFKHLHKSARVKWHDPLTGREIISADEQRPAPESDPAVDTSIFALLDRKAALNARLAERGPIATGKLAREFDKFANDATAHPVRRLRLRHPKGALSREDLSVLSGVPVRTIARIEDRDGAVGDLAYHALAIGLEVRRDQVQPGAIIR
jgi:hypothetical protein